MHSDEVETKCIKTVCTFSLRGEGIRHERAKCADRRTDWGNAVKVTVQASKKQEAGGFLSV